MNIKKAKSIIKEGGLTRALISLFSAEQANISNQITNTPVNENTFNGVANRVGNVNTLFGGGGIFDDVTNFLTIVLAVVSGVFFVWAGWLYLNSSGEPEKVKDANHKLMYSAIGLAVALLARGMYKLVVNIIQNL